MIRFKNDTQLKAVLEFGDMAIKRYHVIPSNTAVKRTKCLTKDTSKAIWHTCNELVGPSKHLLKASHQYVLLGIFSTDHLEKHFGKLCQGCGGTYFITVQQIMEKMAIQKTKICLRFDDGSVLNTTGNHGQSVHACDKCSFTMTENICTIFGNLPEFEMHLPMETTMTLVHIAGYVTRHEDHSSEDTCMHYEQYGHFLSDMNRSSLKIPHDSVCEWVMYKYVMFHDVVEVTCRKSLCKILVDISEYYNLKIEQSHAAIFANILFKNYCHLYSPKSKKEPKQKWLKLSLLR